MIMAYVLTMNITHEDDSDGDVTDANFSEKT